MAHTPHVFAPLPWADNLIDLTSETLHHLSRVLRIRDGETLTYTDGQGTIGTGRLTGEYITRGTEHVVEPPPPVTIATAPPADKDRARFLVEKLGELGVSTLQWLETRHGEGRAPRHDRAQSWSIAALEQSRGAFLMGVEGPLEVQDLLARGPVLFTDPGARSLVEVMADLSIRDALTVAIGPEGGWHASELERATQRVGLGERVLRVETAAVVAASLVIMGVRGAG